MRSRDDPASAVALRGLTRDPRPRGHLEAASDADSLR